MFRKGMSSSCMSSSGPCSASGTAAAGTVTCAGGCSATGTAAKSCLMDSSDSYPRVRSTLFTGCLHLVPVSFQHANSPPTTPATMLRNMLWMAPSLRAEVEHSRLVIVGAGGTGSFVAIYAAHLGFQHIVLCDSDVLSETNLNRYLPAEPSDIGRPKTAVLASFLSARFARLHVATLEQRFPDIGVEREIRQATAAIGCLDDIPGRIALDITTRRVGIPLIDLGVGFRVSPPPNRVVEGAGGQVLVSRRGGPCLRCFGFAVDGDAASYFVDLTPDPSSILLNGVIAGLAMECLLAELAQELSPINRVMLDRRELMVVSDVVSASRTCNICGDRSLAHLEAVAPDRATVEGALGDACRIG
jgi:hypothetical protein